LIRLSSTGKLLNSTKIIPKVGSNGSGYFSQYIAVAHTTTINDYSNGYS
jgi:hypothetical protein